MTLTLALSELPADLPEATAVAGGKAANLGVMARELDLPVPPAFVITTEACRAFLADGWPDGLDDELRSRMAELEAAVGRRFGAVGRPVARQRALGSAGVDAGDDGHDPRSRVERRRRPSGLARATGDEAFADDCRERFEASFRSIVGVADVPDDPWQQLRLAIEAVFRSWQSDRAVAYRERRASPTTSGRR